MKIKPMEKVLVDIDFNIGFNPDSLQPSKKCYFMRHDGVTVSSDVSLL